MINLIYYIAFFGRKLSAPHNNCVYYAYKLLEWPLAIFNLSFHFTCEEAKAQRDEG